VESSPLALGSLYRKCVCYDNYLVFVYALYVYLSYIVLLSWLMHSIILLLLFYTTLTLSI
jgi:hypothetical protein